MPDKDDWGKTRMDTTFHLLPSEVDLDSPLKRRAQRVVVMALYPDTEAIAEVLECLGLEQRY